MRHLTLILLLILACTYTYSKPIIISIADRGIANIKDGQKCYNELLKAHHDAINCNASISYNGIKQIFLDIPKNAESIPLPDSINFANVEFIVNNNSKDIDLFVKKETPIPISLDASTVTSGDFSNINELLKGKKILIIEDKLPWVQNRYGYNYGAQRKDILLLHNGKSLNKTIAPYQNDLKINCSYTDVTNRIINITNISLIRSSLSTYKTFLIKIENENDVTLKNIKITTPVSNLYGDRAITISNCTNVLFDSIRINGTYSDKDKYGYGISLNNIWDLHAINVKTATAWGVFGNNNINTAIIKDSDINRFDIHCYGRDVHCYNTAFNTYYNQFSSMFGELTFNNCIFDNFVPVLLEPSFYAYTPFDIIIKDCEFNVDQKRPYIIQIKFLDSSKFCLRKELEQPQLPNIIIDGFQINAEQIKQLYVYGFLGYFQPHIYNQPSAFLNNIKLISNSQSKLLLVNRNKYIFDNSNININYDLLIR